MANIKSQKKRVLTNEKAHLRNVAVKSGLKTAIRATREAIAAGDKAAAEAAYKVVMRKSPISGISYVPYDAGIASIWNISVQRGTLAVLRNDISVQRGTEYGKNQL